MSFHRMCRSARVNCSIGISVLFIAGAVILTSCSLDAGRTLVVYQKTGVHASGQLLAVHKGQAVLHSKERLSPYLTYTGNAREGKKIRSDMWKELRASASSVPLRNVDSIWIVGEDHVGHDALVGAASGLALTLILYVASELDSGPQGYLSLKGLSFTEWAAVGAVLTAYQGLMGLIVGLIRSSSSAILHPSSAAFESSLREAAAFDDDAPEELDSFLVQEESR